MDKILVDTAAQAGAEVRENFPVTSLLMNDNGAVQGICAHTRGAETREYASIVIGADGMHSLVARQVRAAQFDVIEPLTCNYYSYWSGLKLSGPELCPREGRFIVAAPTNDGLTIINVLAPRADFQSFRANIEQFFLDSLELVPGLRDRVLAGRREERYFGTADTLNFFRQAHGPGWDLAGDAGYHRDAITAQGVTDAFTSAELLAEAIQAGLAERLPWQVALGNFQQQRDRRVAAMYKMSCAMARLAPPDTRQQAQFEALQCNQSATDQFFGTIAGTVPIDSFYSEENLQAILAANAGTWA